MRLISATLKSSHLPNKAFGFTNHPLRKEPGSRPERFQKRTSRLGSNNPTLQLALPILQERETSLIRYHGLANPVHFKQDQAMGTARGPENKKTFHETTSSAYSSAGTHPANKPRSWTASMTRPVDRQWKIRCCG